jgi:hypothetical protein
MIAKQGILFGIWSTLFCLFLRFGALCGFRLGGGFHFSDVISHGSPDEVFQGGLVDVVALMKINLPP